MITRLLSFLVLFVLGFTAPWWLVALGLAVYALVFAGWEIILLAALVDAFFMSTTTVLPLYTLGCTIGLIAVALLRPYMMLYNEVEP